MASRPKTLSFGEETFAFDCQTKKLSPEREYVFAPPRKWRFDFAFPDCNIAVEIEGAIWHAGRHTRGTGFESDCHKYAEAAVLGWRVMRFSTEMVARGEAIAYVLRAMEATKNG